jgi:hypothetical protein
MLHFLSKVKSIIPDLHKVSVIMAIDHKFTIIAILVRVFNRIEKQNLASLAALDGNAIPTIWNLGLSNSR